jgi:hypothetical protein
MIASHQKSKDKLGNPQRWRTGNAFPLNNEVTVDPESEDGPGIPRSPAPWKGVFWQAELRACLPRITIESRFATDNGQLACFG